MFKALLCILFLNLLGNCTGRRKKRENVTNRTTTKWHHLLNNCSSSSIDVRLHDLSTFYSAPKETEPITTNYNHTGIVNVLIPGAPDSLFMCYPRNNDDYRQAYFFSHVACRHLGYMTFVAMNQREVPSNDKRYFGFRQKSYMCTGQEQTVSSCNWNDVSVGGCSKLTEVSCDACHGILNDTSGIIKSPGFPLAYLFDVTCEWDVIVPEKHTIQLSFHHFDGVQSDQSEKSCGLHKPYIELVYGIQSKISVHRYCNFREVKNFSVPSNEVKIRIFTGFYSNARLFKLPDKEQGVAISFEAIPADLKQEWPWKMIFFTCFFISFIAIIMVCHYCQKYEGCYVREQSIYNLPGPNAPAVEDLNRAYEFQRCNIQGRDKVKHGLRLRSNGSGAKFSGIFFSHAPETNYEIAKSFRKFPTQAETPKTMIPAIILNDGVCEQEKLNPIWKVKANLLDRYSDKDGDGMSGSRMSVDSSVFYPALPSFQIYKSTSSEPGNETEKNEHLPHETAL